MKGLIVKKVIELVIKEFKLDKIKKYVEEPNELDSQVGSMQKTLSKYGKYIEELEKEVAILKADSHPQRDFVVCENCKCKLKEK
jgi:septal ring factor EnvC (AmiA/AmiB activator)